MTSRALSLLAAFASPVFMAAAIGGWLSGLLPANPLTLGVSALLVIGGPVLGIVHVATAKEYDEEEYEQETAVLARPAAARAVPVPAPRPVPVPVPEPLLLTPRAAAARRFAAWREMPHPAIEQRERERRASRYLRS